MRRMLRGFRALELMPKFGTKCKVDPYQCHPWSTTVRLLKGRFHPGKDLLKRLQFPPRRKFMGMVGAGN